MLVTCNSTKGPPQPGTEAEHRAHAVWSPGHLTWERESWPVHRESDSDMSTERYVCMGCQGQGSSSVSFFDTYKAAACHYARSPVCNQSGRSISMITVQTRPTDRDAGGSGAAGQWAPPSRGAVHKYLIGCLNHTLETSYISYFVWYIAHMVYTTLGIYHRYIPPSTPYIPSSAVRHTQKIDINHAIYPKNWYVPWRKKGSKVLISWYITPQLRYIPWYITKNRYIPWYIPWRNKGFGFPTSNIYHHIYHGIYYVI